MSITIESTSAYASETASGHAAPVVEDLDAPPAPPGAQRLASLGASLLWALVGFAAFTCLWALGASRVDNLPGPATTLSRLREMLANAFFDDGPNDQGVGLLLRASLTRVF